MAKSSVNVGSKFPLYILILCFFCFSLIGLICYVSVGQILTEQYKREALEFAEFAAKDIDGDEFLSITSESDEAYAKIYDSLSKYHGGELVAYIYTMRLDGDEVFFVVDTDINDPADFGERYPLLESMKPAFSGVSATDKEPTTDKWGTFFSAYVPIYSKDGTVAGIVGCDVDISNINSIKANLRNVIIIIISLFFVIYFSFYYYLSYRMVNRDFLTELLNYDGLIKKGESLKASGRLSDFTAILINIKDFKYLNQKMGANSGDIVLRKYSAILKKSVSGSEQIARTGSDNFLALVLKEHEDAFLQKLSDIKIELDIDGKTELTAISSRCGIYPIQPDDTIKEAMNSASMALKESRISSSPDYVRFEKVMVSSMVEEKNILADYKRALEEKEFTVYYQPKVNINDCRLCGAEALVRWIKDGKVMSPAAFIPVLEKENLIAELDFYVFETVCSNIKEWQDKGLIQCPISSNFSKVHLANPNFAEDIIAVVNKYSIDPKLVEIELTESSGYSDFDALTRFVDIMNRESIHTSIDDFGTGYSSLSMLKDINVDVVKIDKSFLAEDKQQEKLLENVIKMITDLDRTVICEGVENKEQLEFLQQAKCNIIQGYFFDKPLPREEFEKRLADPTYDVG